MSGIKSVFSAVSSFLFVGLMLFGLIVPVDAQTRRNEREVRDIVRSLQSKIDDFQYSLTYELKNNSADQSEIADIDDNLRNLNSKINHFQSNLDRKRENRDDVTSILDAAKTVNDYLNQNTPNRKFQSDWTSIRGLLDRLAQNYNVAASWNGGSNNQTSGNRPNGNNYPNNNRNPNQNDNRRPNNYPQTNSNANSYGLTGTYQLDTTRSENVNDAINDSNVGSDDQRRAILETLDSPEQIAIDVRGNQVTMASSKGSPATYTADGRDVSQPTSNGVNVRQRATLSGQQLTLTNNAGETSSTTTFVSTDNGQTLKVTRSLTTDYLNQTIFVDSVYRKTESIARLGINNSSNVNQNDNANDPNDNANGGVYSSSDSNDRNNQGGNNPNNNPNGNYPPTTSGRTGNFIIPNGTIISASLDNDINTKLSQNNDRFRMTVQSPDEYRGATVEGYISGVNRSGKVSGRSQITFNFERITLRDGQTYDFAGFLQNIKDLNGKDVKIDAEGTAQGGNQTKETVKRGGIGAGIGAVIGAIAGGGTGAAIGAVIGGAGGAGSVIVQGKDDLELRQGSTITVQASSPVR